MQHTNNKCFNKNKHELFSFSYDHMVSIKFYLGFFSIARVFQLNPFHLCHFDFVVIVFEEAGKTLTPPAATAAKVIGLTHGHDFSVTFCVITLSFGNF